MSKRFWTIIFILVIMQASVFGYALNINKQLQEQSKQNNSEEIIANQQIISQDINQIIQVIRGLMIQVQYLTQENEKNKAQLQQRISNDNIKIG
jgi:hypothetical protein